MDAVDILKVCLRRWYVMLPILLGAAGVSYQLVQAQETTYTAFASYGLVQASPPKAPVKGEDVLPNPLGANDGALIGEALEAQLNSRETQQELGGGETRGWGPGEVDDHSYYAVEIPLYETTYEVRAWGEDEGEVRDVVDRVVEAAPGITAELQDRASAPEAGRYQPFLLATTQVQDLPSTSGKKLVVAVMGVGVLMGAAWSIVADRLLRQLPRRRDRARAGTGAAGPGPEDARTSAPAPTVRSGDPDAPDASGRAEHARPPADPMAARGRQHEPRAKVAAGAGAASRLDGDRPKMATARVGSPAPAPPRSGVATPRPSAPTVAPAPAKPVKGGKPGRGPQKRPGAGRG